MDKEFILKETLFLIKEKGFTFTVSDIAAKIGKSKRTIYALFSSKEEIIEMLITNIIKEMKQREAEIAENNELTALEKINRILISLPNDFDLINIRLLTELKKYYYEQWKTLDAYIQQDWSTIRKLLQQGMDDKEIRHINIDLFIQLYLGSISQIYDVNFPLKHDYSMKHILTSTMEILLHGISNR
ncbi:TetR/AcrR family transcriptional regulator [Niallia sp. 03133]|uniref:TetR/AcrR family transcriptional regulator n=1 Tax=Niallia sp. 03133 TaxID=3458060 RepID=UPI00404458AA